MLYVLIWPAIGICSCGGFDWTLSDFVRLKLKVEGCSKPTHCLRRARALLFIFQKVPVEVEFCARNETIKKPAIVAKFSYEKVANFINGIFQRFYSNVTPVDEREENEHWKCSHASIQSRPYTQTLAVISADCRTETLGHHQASPFRHSPWNG